MEQTMTQNIPLEELARLPSFYATKLSCAGDKIAFYGDKSGRLELYIMDLKERQPRQLSHGEVPRSPHAGFAWSRDDCHIVFAKDQDGNEQHDLYQIDVDTGSVTQLTSDPECQEYPAEISPDNQWLTVVSNKFGQLNLYKLNLESRKYTQLTNYPNPVFGGGNWSPDGKKIAFVVNESPELKNLDLYLLDVETNEPKLVLSVAEGSQESVADWHPQGQFLAITSDASGVNRPGLLNLSTGEVRWLGEEGINESAVRFSHDGRYLACIRNVDSEMRPVLYDTETGERRDLNLPAGLAYGASFTPDDTQLVTLFTTPTTRSELVLYNLNDDTYESLLPAEYGSIDPAVFVTSEHIWYPSFDGRNIPALLYKPKDLPEGEKLPAIVIVHGGPTSQWLRSFDPYAQFLVDNGYVVLAPNIRGSTGYGVEFRDLNRYDWGGGDLEDVAYGADYLKTLPFVDGQRLGIFGGSYGGYMTFMQVVKKPDLWKAASAAVGITDLRLLYDESMEHFKYMLRFYLGDPAENAKLWYDRSAVNFADRLKSKLQIIHGLNDPRCPISQARVFRDRLLKSGFREGKDFEFVEFGDQGHGSADIEHKIKWYSLLVEFMNHNL